METRAEADAAEAIIDAIQKAAAEHFGITQEQLIARKKVPAMDEPRQIAIWLAKQLTTRKLGKIGRQFGGRDHSTVLYSINKIDKLRAADPELQRRLETLAAKVKGRLPSDPQ